MKHIASAIRILFLALFLFLLRNGKAELWLAIFSISLVAALIFGKIYCGYVCPINALIVLVEWLSRKFKIQKSKAPKWLKNGYFTWITLGVSILMIFTSKNLLYINLPLLPFWIVVSVLVTFIYKPAVFHNLICPFGALQRIFGRFAWLSKRVDKDACVGCRLCEKTCPSSAIVVVSENKKALIDIALCHQCINCGQVCPKNAIHYSK